MRAVQAGSEVRLGVNYSSSAGQVAGRPDERREMGWRWLSRNLCLAPALFPFPTSAPELPPVCSLSLMQSARRTFSAHCSILWLCVRVKEEGMY
jgi:hypothetical protein